jgi:hypothetical protein
VPGSAQHEIDDDTAPKVRKSQPSAPIGGQSPRRLTTNLRCYDRHHDYAAFRLRFVINMVDDLTRWGIKGKPATGEPTAKTIAFLAGSFG